MSTRRRPSSRRRRPARGARPGIIPRVSGWLPFYGAGMLTSALIVGEDIRQVVTSFLSSPVVALAVPLLVAFWWNATHSIPPAPVRTTLRPRTTVKGKGSVSLGASATARPRRETTSIAPGAMRDAAIRAALPTEEATAPSEMTFRSDPSSPASRRLVTGSVRAAGAVSTAVHRAHARLLPDPLARQISDAGIDLDE